MLALFRLVSSDQRPSLEVIRGVGSIIQAEAASLVAQYLTGQMLRLNVFTRTQALLTRTAMFYSATGLDSLAQTTDMLKRPEHRVSVLEALVGTRCLGLCRPLLQKELTWHNEAEKMQSLAIVTDLVQLAIHASWWWLFTCFRELELVICGSALAPANPKIALGLNFAESSALLRDLYGGLNTDGYGHVPEVLHFFYKCTDIVAAAFDSSPEFLVDMCPRIWKEGFGAPVFFTRVRQDAYLGALRARPCDAIVDGLCSVAIGFQPVDGPLTQRADVTWETNATGLWRAAHPQALFSDFWGAATSDLYVALLQKAVAERHARLIMLLLGHVCGRVRVPAVLRTMIANMYMSPNAVNDDATKVIAAHLHCLVT